MIQAEKSQEEYRNGQLGRKISGNVVAKMQSPNSGKLRRNKQKKEPERIQNPL